MKPHTTKMTDPAKQLQFFEAVRLTGELADVAMVMELGVVATYLVARVRDITGRRSGVEMSK